MPGVHIRGANIVVDTFKEFHEPVVYFLTHAHSDHLVGLTQGWSRGIIYCTALTKLFLQENFGIDDSHIIALEVGKSSLFSLPNVTPIDANHCPGAVMFLFEGSYIPGDTILHTGDFRYNPTIMNNILSLKQIHTLYLDNTYILPTTRDPLYVSIISISNLFFLYQILYLTIFFTTTNIFHNTCLVQNSLAFHFQPKLLQENRF
eukprot:GSMAST32.ASY1.ANO1.207.1 assembled CDS